MLLLSRDLLSKTNILRLFRKKHIISFRSGDKRRKISKWVRRKSQKCVSGLVTWKNFFPGMLLSYKILKVDRVIILFKTGWSDRFYRIFHANCSNWTGWSGMPDC